jgi:hypothetical protein
MQELCLTEAVTGFMIVRSVSDDYLAAARMVIDPLIHQFRVTLGRVATVA